MYFRAFRLVASDSVNLIRKQKPCRKSSYWVLDNFTWTQTLANDLTYPSWKRCATYCRYVDGLLEFEHLTLLPLTAPT